MNTLQRIADLAIVVPFHNEERYLRSLIHSLRSQSAQDVPVVFIDNASTDHSRDLIQRAPEVEAGKWTVLEERKIGKVHAMKTATRFCMDRFGVEQVGFLDADSHLGDGEWIRNSLDIVEKAKHRFGYTYSPLTYYGFDELPNFNAAYRAYEAVLHFVVQNIGWLANGQGFVCSTDTLMNYFENAEITTEVDLRCALLALAEGRQAYLNPTMLVSSGRRTIVNARNFASWCFYAREFYSKKDINAESKLDLNARADVEDLQPNMVGQFFRRRAMKITCRHVLPLLIFDQGGLSLQNTGRVFGAQMTENFRGLARQFRGKTEFLLTDRFETMIRTIENDPACIAFANAIEDLMRARHGRFSAPLAGRIETPIRPPAVVTPLDVGRSRPIRVAS